MQPNNNDPSTPWSYTTNVQHAGKDHRLGQGLIGATEGSVTYRTPALTDKPVYSRLGNTTNHLELEELLARLHGAPSALATGSGMACLNLIITSLLKPGDHVLVLDACYGGTFNILTKIFSRWGVETSFAPLKEWPSSRRVNTKMVIFESITNPFCVPQDLSMAIGFAKQHGLLSVCDNTFASPILCQPLLHGADLVFESATKYLNGHSDVVAGVIAGSADLIDRLRIAHAYLGTFLAPPQCIQLMRGIRTLPLRMKQHTQAACEFVRAMKASNFVETVSYGSNKSNQLEMFFPEGFGGMVSVRFRSNIDMSSLMGNLRLVTNVPSLGGTETTVTLPAYTTNWFMSLEQKQRQGIDEQLARFSIGLEHPDDIVADVLRALDLSHHQA